MTPTAGYSGTPLPQKLGIKPGYRLALHHAPDGYLATLGELPPGVKIREDGRGPAEVVHYFTTSRTDLGKALKGLGRSIYPDCALWISWPKKTSGVPSDLDENGVRELALPLGLVDVKVCAIDATWSGLKLMWRKELRRPPSSKPPKPQKPPRKDARRAR